MLLAISRFKVANSLQEDVEAAFGLLGREVFTDISDPSVFHLLTRWTDVESFRQWHSGRAQDAADTEVVFWNRVDGKEGPPGTVVDWLPMLSEYIATSDAVCYAVAAADGTIQACSAGMAAALDAGAEDLIGKSLFDFLAEHSRETVMNDVAAGRRLFRESSLLNFVSSRGERLTLECRLDVQPHSFAIVGCPPRRGSLAYMKTLEELNNRLAVEKREGARKEKELEHMNRKLEETLHQLDTAYWHLRKIREVLPICLDCGKVKTGDGSWESVVQYLKTNSEFLSHGYCPECYERAANALGQS